MQDMTGKTALITGASDGIGRETARQLAALHAHVIMHGRNPAKTERAAVWARAQTGSDTVDTLIADLAEQAQIRRMADEFNSRFDRLDVLINNAGIYNISRRETVDGIEEVFAVNHLAYFLLTHLLLDTLKASAPARIVNVSSSAHYGQSLDMDDPQLARSYSGGRAYGQSKLANLHFTYELARRLEGSGVTVNAVHPGFVRTNLGANNVPLIGSLVKWIVSLSAISPREGARTPVYLASSPEVAGISGQFFVREKPRRSSETSYDEVVARRLWEISEELTGLSGNGGT